jgi:exodeoxyribonuclease VII small subunit
LTKSKKPLDFETALAELEKLVDKMEAGEVPLEDSLRDFERGIELTRTCQQALEAAEQKVQILLQQDTESEPQDFDSEA